MAYALNSNFRFGYKLTLVLLIACLSGFLWAMAEREPWDQKMNAPLTTKKKPNEITPPILPTKKEPIPHPPKPIPKTTEEPDKIEEPKQAPSVIMEAQLDALFQKVQRRLTHAEFEGAAGQHTCNGAESSDSLCALPH